MESDPEISVEMDDDKTSFAKLAKPRIYAYSDIHYKGYLKIGYTSKSVIDRVKAQYPITTPEQSWKIELDKFAVRDDGGLFKDYDVHRVLESKGIKRVRGEWFECTVDDVENAILELKTGQQLEPNRRFDFGMRPEQEQAVKKTIAYFEALKKENSNITPHFLWNAKMRFGKTFATYQLAKKMAWKKVLILTFKPAVQNAWQEDLKSHIDFVDWQFVVRNGLTYEACDKSKPIVCFASFQDFLGKSRSGGIKLKNQWAHEINWDCVVFDEYHYGAWRETARDLFEGEDEQERLFAQSKDLIEFEEENLPITTNHYLYLSGTPFRAMSSGEFIEEQIFNWTYSDEQKAKKEWLGENNPYDALPEMVMMTYQLPDSVRSIALRGEYNEFDLNEFFSATGADDHAKFQHENEVQKWLDFIQNKLSELNIDTLRMGKTKPPMPFSDVDLMSSLLHTFWFLPNVASCYAMRNLLRRECNQFFSQYQIVVAAGSRAGVGIEALPPVKEAMGDNPLETKSITLSCGKLTTGVSVSPWAGIFMLRNMSSPETYFQAAFRVQTPWVLRGNDCNDPNNEEIVKKQCYVFDFAPDRALRQISDYSCRLDTENSNPEQKVAEFIRFLPVLAYDGSSMRKIDASGILDIAMSGTTATMLAKRWESALLVNVDNATLQRLINNEDAMRALMKIEGFRSLNQDITTIINKSDAVKKVRQEKGDNITQVEKKQLDKEEKEYKSLRKKIQEKLIKFATRIPVFMYLSDYREHCLRDVITKLEPDLFYRVTGLTQDDFELLARLNVFNESLMNDAVYKFRRYEDSSLSYTGIDRNQNNSVGLYTTVLSREDSLNY
ncbi:GIY-YIG nuclease family protein [Pelistega sp. MC2]|uniref:GIY-YIG nuclease family protein n=1 Tax=Pelistega sp. MC2 TaxID=1720297 RepID=UPI000A441729|nr:GIY-YIG nuclease family protein [Pelistega sp. MC2]